MTHGSCTREPFRTWRESNNIAGNQSKYLRSLNTTLPMIGAATVSEASKCRSYYVSVQSHGTVIVLGRADGAFQVARRAAQQYGYIYVQSAVT